ncbi:MAG: glutamyl-tRNA reductase [Chloroflexi bacterium]|nr:glutamyl-tRNA reductase [Chloroflexota bacterium]
MPFLALGLEHKTAPLPVRECVALEGDTLARACLQLAAEPAVAEVAILSTCNRTEIYLFSGAVEDAAAQARGLLIAPAGTLHGSLDPYLQVWEDMDAVEHLFRVASGLESQLLGEVQILSQVREALETAQRLGTIGPNLHSLFRSAISCARQARAGTALGRRVPSGCLSLGGEVVRAAEQELETLAGRSALLIGGGEISRLVAEELSSRGLKSLFIANRTASVATNLAEQWGGHAALLSDITRLLPHVDLVVSATSAQHYVLTPEDIPAAGLPRPLHIYDLALPRDVDPAVGSLPGVTLHDLDSLLPSGLVSHWDEDIRLMEGVIAAEVQEFMAWYLTRRAAPVIANLRSHVEAVSRQEMKRVAPQLADLTDRERAAVESLTQRLIDKMFHHLVVRLRLAAQTDPRLVEAAEFFFLHGEGGLFEHAATRQEEKEPQT